MGFGCWVLGFVFWVLGSGFWVLGFGFWVLCFGFWAGLEVVGLRFGLSGTYHQATTTLAQGHVPCRAELRKGARASSPSSSHFWESLCLYLPGALASVAIQRTKPKLRKQSRHSTCGGFRK